MNALQSQHSLTALCAAFGVSRSGYHAWKSRRPSARADTDAELGRHLCQAHTDSRQTYGSPRLLEALQKKGLRDQPASRVPPHAPIRAARHPTARLPPADY